MDFHFTSHQKGFASMVAANHLSADEDTAAPPESEWQHHNRQTLFHLLEESAEKLTALEAAVGLASAHTLWLLNCFHDDLEQARAELAHPQQRLDVLGAYAQPIYILAKQIDAFANTSLRLERQREQKERQRAAAANTALNDRETNALTPPGRPTAAK
jgi:hypothetical protein